GGARGHHAPGRPRRRARRAIHPLTSMAAVPPGDGAPRRGGPGGGDEPPRARGADRGPLLRRPRQWPAFVSPRGRAFRFAARAPDGVAYVPRPRPVRARGRPARAGRVAVAPWPAHHRPLPLPAPRSPRGWRSGGGRGAVRRPLRYADLEHPG